MAYRYEDAGVSRARTARFLAQLGSIVPTHTAVEEGIGGFAGIIAYPGDPDKLLAAATDGVGTKILLALEAKQHAGIGIDLVAMCVNDLLCVGAKPLCFLDYYASARLDEEVAAAVLHGILQGCEEAGCVLLGGETAELPGMYAEGHYDLAGTAIGTLSRSQQKCRDNVRAGDLVFGIASSGLHANGFSLVRKIFATPAQRDQWRSELLRPTRIYTKIVESLYKEQLDIVALAHITGGGLVENLPRVLPQGLQARLRRGSWPVPPVMQALAAHVAEDELPKTFNMGIGLCAVLRASDAARAVQLAASMQVPAYLIGEIEPCEGAPCVVWDGRNFF